MLKRQTDPVTTVGAIITRQNDSKPEILLIQRNSDPYKQYWALPGGHIEQNETTEAAIQREVREETGLKFSGQFLFYSDEIIPDKAIHAVVLIFNGTASGTINVQEDEVSEARWYTSEQALSLPLAFRHHAIIQRFQTLHNSQANHHHLF